MTRHVLLRYLIGGEPVGRIASETGESRASVRAYLRDGGIVIRAVNGSYPLGRDPVCDSVKRAGFGSFHEFAKVNSLNPITEQAAALSVSEKSLVRVYNSYRKLLRDLKLAGIALPTTQSSGADLERRSRGT